MAQEQQQKQKAESASDREQREEADEAAETEVIHRTVRADIARTWWPTNP